MAAHNTLGKAGEDAVAEYLERKGYDILHRNWRKNRLELDIVDADSDCDPNDAVYHELSNPDMKMIETGVRRPDMPTES